MQELIASFHLTMWRLTCAKISQVLTQGCRQEVVKVEYNPVDMVLTIVSLQTPVSLNSQERQTSDAPQAHASMPMSNLVYTIQHLD